MANLSNILILSAALALSSASAFATGQDDAACNAQQAAQCGGEGQVPCKAPDAVTTVDPGKATAGGATLTVPAAPAVNPPVSAPPGNGGH